MIIVLFFGAASWMMSDSCVAVMSVAVLTMRRCHQRMRMMISDEGENCSKRTGMSWYGSLSSYTDFLPKSEAKSTPMPPKILPRSYTRFTRYLKRANKR